MRITIPAAIAVALALATRAAAGQPAPATADAAACSAALPLRWIDETGTPRAVLAAAEEEASRIWAGAGIAIAWVRPGGGRGIRQDDLLVILRAVLPKGPAATDAQRRGRVLGRVVRESESRPGRLIEVAMPAVLAALANQRMFLRPLTDLPGGVHERAAGRALGRVVAHEIGHWLFGREHAPDGLMQASIPRPDLVAAVAPDLPQDWPATAAARLRARRPCPS